MRLPNACKIVTSLVGVILLLPLVLLVPRADVLTAATNQNPSSAAATITGTWQFRNRENSAFIPARHFLTKVCDADGIICDENSLDHTDMNGNFTLETERFSGQTITVRLMAWASYGVAGDSNNVSVIGAGSGAPSGSWEYLSEPFSSSLRQAHQVPFTALELPAFWIMDDFTDGMLKIPATDQGSINVQAFWGYNFDKLPLPGVTVDRSLFCHGSLGIFEACTPGFLYLFAQDIRDGPFGNGLTNRVPLHEMGHAVQYALYGDKLPAPTTDYYLYSLGSWSIQPCATWFTDVAIPGEPDCAWQEGFADWWRIHVQNSPFVTSQARTLNYEDTSSWDQGDETPGRIAGALWDIVDTEADGTDASDFEVEYIWIALKLYSAGGNSNDIDGDFADYWATWKSLYSMADSYGRLQCAATSIYQNGITYDADGWLPCAYARTGLSIQVSANGGTVDEFGRARVPVSIEANGLTLGDGTSILPPGGIGAFDNLLSYDPEGMEILGADFDGTGFTGQLDLGTARRIKVRGAATQEVYPPVTLASILPRLTGSALETYSMGYLSPQPAQPYTYSATRTGAGSTDAQFIHFKRGDAKSDGRVDIADAMFIVQYLNGIRPACDVDLEDVSCMQTVNAASVRHDGSIADKVTIDDARAIAEYVIGIRDEFFNPVERE